VPETTKRMKNENFAVRVTLSPEQARAVVTAIDFYMRIRLGQFKELARIFADRGGHLDGVAHCLNAIKAIIYPEMPTDGATYSISGVPYKDAKVGFDVLQVVRNAEAWGCTPQGGITVNFDSPSFVSESYPRPKAEILGPLEMLAASGFDVGKPDKKGHRKLRKR
jgi:hypothetical protein